MLDPSAPAAPDDDDGAAEDDLDAEPTPTSGWAQLRWLPAFASCLLGLNLVAISVVSALRVAAKLRSAGWDSLLVDQPAGTTPGLVLLRLSGGLLAMGFAGLSGLVAARAWAGLRWSSALVFSTTLLVWLVVGGYLLGLAQFKF